MPAQLLEKAPQQPSSRRERYARVLAFMRRQSPQQRFETMVEAGILTADGKLQEPYRPSADESAESS